MFTSFLILCTEVLHIRKCWDFQKWSRRTLLCAKFASDCYFKVVYPWSDGPVYLRGPYFFSTAPADVLASDGARPSIQQAHDAITTSFLHQNDVATSFWRNNDVLIVSCACWEQAGWWLKNYVVLSISLKTGDIVQRLFIMLIVFPGSNCPDILDVFFYYFPLSWLKMFNYFII